MRDVWPVRGFGRPRPPGLPQAWGRVREARGRRRPPGRVLRGSGALPRRVDGARRPANSRYRLTPPIGVCSTTCTHTDPPGPSRTKCDTTWRPAKLGAPRRLAIPGSHSFAGPSSPRRGSAKTRRTTGVSGRRSWFHVPGARTSRSRAGWAPFPVAGVPAPGRGRGCRGRWSQAAWLEPGRSGTAAGSRRSHRLRAAWVRRVADWVPDRSRGA
jgi:hypothetical protein